MKLIIVLLACMLGFVASIQAATVRQALNQKMDTTPEVPRTKIGSDTAAAPGASGASGTANIVTTLDLPAGPYMSTCQSCYMSGRNEVLTCSCKNNNNNYVSTTLQNAWVASEYIINNSGKLAVKIPNGATNSGQNSYKNFCSGCGVSFGSLVCLDCNFRGPPAPLINAYTCNTVGYDTAFNTLICYGNTNAPTFPTPMPTVPTLPPTPGSVRQCKSYWTDFTFESAPYKACAGGEFKNKQGCQYQNYCCWQQAGSNSGSCVVPATVPVDCPNLLNQNACSQYSDVCYWDPNYANQGLCRRSCPGDPQVLCA